MISSLSRILTQAAAPFYRRFAYTSTGPAIYCPRCDKPLTPDHRCLSRRHFFGLLGGAAAAALVKPAVPACYRPPAISAVSLDEIEAISSRLYRIPIPIYRGGAYLKFNPDGGDLGRNSYDKLVVPTLTRGPR